MDPVDINRQLIGISETARIQANFAAGPSDSRSTVESESQKAIDALREQLGAKLVEAQQKRAVKEINSVLEKVGDALTRVWDQATAAFAENVSTTEIDPPKIADPPPIKLTADVTGIIAAARGSAEAAARILAFQQTVGALRPIVRQPGTPQQGPKATPQETAVARAINRGMTNLAEKVGQLIELGVEIAAEPSVVLSGANLGGS
jgi:hypothetical protein